jgi:hypothetical protein
MKIAAMFIQFIFTAVTWKTLIGVLSESDLNALGIFIGLQFIATSFLLGSHTDLANFIIDGKPHRTTFTFAMLVHIPIIFLSIPIILFNSDSILAIMGLNPSDRYLLMIWFITLIFVSPVATIQHIFLGNSKLHIYTLFQLLSSFVSFVIINSFLKTQGFSNPIYYYLSFIAGTLIFVVASLVYIKKVNGISMTNPRNLFTRNILSRINWGSLVLSLLGPFSLQMDRILVSNFGGPDDIQTINAVNKIALTSMILFSYISSVYFPSIKGAATLENFKQFFITVYSKCLIMAIAITLILNSYVTFVTSNQIEVGFDLEFSFLLFLNVYAISIIMQTFLRQRTDQIFLALMGLLNIPATYFLSSYLIPKNGIAGLYLSFSIVYILGILFPATLRIKATMKRS